MSDDAQAEQAQPVTPDDASPFDFDALRTAASNRRPDGTFAPNNLSRLVHGRRVRVDHPALAPLVTEREDALLADLGGPDALSTSERWAVQEAARLQVLASAAGENVGRLGLTTSKGAARAAVRLYLDLRKAAADQVAVLGWKRRAKPTGPTHLADYLEQQR